MTTYKRKTKKAPIKRSGFEDKISDLLQMMGIDFEYEPKDKKVSYTNPASNHTYLPDFVLPNGVIIEAKGRWTMADRKKQLLIKNQHPELDIRISFQNPSVKISKGSKTTYAAWAEKNGITWGTFADIPEWCK